MPSATHATKDSQNKSSNTQANRSTRLLLALWGWEKTNVPKGKLTERLKRKGEKASDYKDVFAQLQEKDAITIVNGEVTILDTGRELLGHHLKNGDLAIEGTIVGTWVAKALCKWLQQTEVSTSGWSSNGKVASDAIASYEEFKPVALEVFDRLNRDYNMDNLVPIYRIRREIGDRISRSQFNDWMLELQSSDVLQFVEGTVEDSAPDKIEDSITTKLGKLRCYAKRISA